MSLSGSRRRKKSKEYKVLIVPQGEGGVTRSIRASRWRVLAWGIAASSVFFLVFILAFRFTPLGFLTGTRSAVGADSAAVETDRRIRALAEEVGILKDYNTQLRKALGARIEKDALASTTEQHQEEISKPSASEQSVSGEDYNSPASIGGHVVQSSESVNVALPMLNPVDGIITRGFEPEQKHFGVDFAAKEGTTVHAAAQGYVVFSDWTYNFGYTIILSHGNGFITVYKHNRTLFKSTGTMVRRGELIGLVGNTGSASSGPHLHFEVLKDGLPQDPQEFLLNAKPAS